MKPEGSSPYSQELATCPRSEPDRSSLYISPPPIDHLEERRSYRRIGLIPMFLLIFRNTIHFLRWGVVSTSPNSQAGGPPLVGCPRLLLQHIRSYPPYLEAVSPSATWRRAMPWWQGPTCLWQGPTCDWQGPTYLAGIHKRRVYFLHKYKVF